MHLKILSPEKTLFDGEAHSAAFPGTLGTFQVLQGHAPILSSLVEGKVVIRTQDRELSIPISGGFFEFSHNQGVVLADSPPV